jgi:hypothetical protein
MGRVVSRRWGFGVGRGERQGEGRAGKLQSDAVKRQSGNERNEVGKLTCVGLSGARGTIVRSKFGRCASQAFFPRCPALCLSGENAQTAADWSLS